MRMSQSRKLTHFLAAAAWVAGFGVTGSSAQPLQLLSNRENAQPEIYIYVKTASDLLFRHDTPVDAETFKPGNPRLLRDGAHVNILQHVSGGSTISDSDLDDALDGMGTAATRPGAVNCTSDAQNPQSDKPPLISVTALGPNAKENAGKALQAFTPMGLRVACSVLGIVP